ncbi:MAG: hypothetical protein AB1777_04400 [Bacteroidota bacterium]
MLLTTNAYSKVGGFEGKINIIREGAYDTILVEVYIKGEYVRVNEFDKGNKLIRSYFANVAQGNTFLVSFSRRMYSKIKVEYSPMQSKVEIIKSENYIDIDGNRCYQWRVKNPAGQTETTYWVAPIQYDIVPKLCRALANSGSAIEEMVSIPHAEGVMPLMVVDRTRFRKVRSCIRVVNVKPMQVSQSVFAIPSGFNELISS